MRHLTLTLTLALLCAACSVDENEPGGGFLFRPEQGCYFQLDVINADTGVEEYIYDVSLPLSPRPPSGTHMVCPGDEFETFLHPYGEYVLRLHRVDGEVVEVEVVLDRSAVVVSDG